MLLVSVAGGRVTSQTRLRVPVNNLVDLMGILKRYRLDTLVCGGISPDARESLAAEAVAVVDNVVGSVWELVPAIEEGALKPGYGLSAGGREGGRKGRTGAAGRTSSRKGNKAASVDGLDGAGAVDCLRCRDRICLSGGNCMPGAIPAWETLSDETRKVLDAAADVSLERERQLCRLAELVYFCLGMRYRTLGLAYCLDLQEPARILSGVLRRFFEVVPVCCKVGGVPQESASGAEGGAVACNPVGQAALLNRAGTDLNVIVGLCIGADTVFTRHSEAPVTTLFVKDRSLANNPIGALYSEYYLRESLLPSQLSGAPSAVGAGGRSPIREVSRAAPDRRGLEEKP
jgi:uncharacterized metal-binding protein